MNINPYYGNEQLDDHLSSLHREMKSLRIECDRLINKHLLVEDTLNQSSAAFQNPDTSSAYNTGGESCRSNSITPDANNSPPDCVHCPTRSPRMVHRSQPLPSPKNSRRNYEEPRVVDLAPRCDSAMSRNSELSLKTPGYAEQPEEKLMPTRLLRKITPLRLLPKKDSYEYAKRFRIPAFSIVLKDQKKSKKEEAVNVDAVHMPRFFRSPQAREKLYLFDKPVNEVLESEDGEIAGTSERGTDTQTVIHEPVQYKWKVKRRCDGTRYVVKRPYRSQILKKREAQLNKERSGVSTDDDAHSELKLGHFHTREERKRHLEKERLRKEKTQQKMMETKLADQTIVRLSQRKMQKKKEQMLLDGFVTTQEVLSQRNTSTTGKHGILSVTTV